MVAKFLFAIHILFVALIPIGLLIDSDIFDGYLGYHFAYCIVLLTSLYLWGAIWSTLHRMPFRRMCVLTSLTGLARGFALSDPRNYETIFLEEFCEFFGITKQVVPYIEAAIVMLITISAIRYVNYQIIS